MKNKKEPLYYDGRHFDLQYGHIDDDIPFYLRHIKKYGEPVLELGCGTGRVTIPIAEKKIDIVGLDYSEAMLEHAKNKAAKKNVRIDWVKADCRDFTIKRKFNLIIFPWNSLAHLLDFASVNSCFSRVKNHLADEGRFIIDMWNPKLEILMRDPSSHYPVAEYPDPDGKGIVTITQTNVYDAATQINRIKWYYKFEKQPKELVEELDVRNFFPQELDAALRYNGFEIESKYGNYDESQFASTSPKQLIVSRIHNIYLP